MKIFTTTAITFLMASAATAGAIGGNFELTYGAGGVYNESGEDYHGSFFDTYAAKGSVGASTNSGLGWQVDLEYQSTNFTDTVRALTESYGGTLHGNYDIAGFKLGGFAGYGYGAFTTHSGSGTSYWYGLEAAKTFGNFALTAQVGLASSDSTHNPIDYNDELFGGIQARYFLLDDRAMITASYENGNGIIHGDTMNAGVLDLSGTLRLGQSNFYGTLGYQNTRINADFGSNSEGQGTEERFYLGVSMLFGGSLRDVYAGSTPMMGNELQSLSNALTDLYD